MADKNKVSLLTNTDGTVVTTPVVGAQVRVFDRNSTAFKAVAGSTNPDPSLFPTIFKADAGRVGACLTNTTGVCFAGEAATGNYLVIVRFFDTATGKRVYLGKQKAPSDFVNGIASKDFQVMKVFKKGVFIGYQGSGKSAIAIE